MKLGDFFFGSRLRDRRQSSTSSETMPAPIMPSARPSRLRVLMIHPNGTHGVWSIPQPYMSGLKSLVDGDYHACPVSMPYLQRFEWRPLLVYNTMNAQRVDMHANPLASQLAGMVLCGPVGVVAAHRLVDRNTPPFGSIPLSFSSGDLRRITDRSR